ncbi:M20/M25/M40 family metallo-hydrolase [Pedobacter sp. CFBP9032]|uniref:M20/M25/M40 family metallo-hydrolase n=1 Tax=Pedobacter sp. CFBP9032 TaxID=3096539 RepID=UPI002A69C15F|nr:M20/M25/M40 family metallo-hydrolase [Pedobacter sp. CFBP9032]MDY0903496.1 M20/M25/M40 family metallo-hydrolase [Pedobacter sp. CFBP9032]
MKYLFSTIIICSTLFSNAQDKFGGIFSKINTDVQQNSKAYQTLKYETETIGHRLTGSANGAKAEQYAYDLLKSYGCDVKFQPFEVESWARKTISVEIGTDKGNLTKMKAVTLAHSPINADITGEIVDAGNGMETDYQADPAKFKGKIALIYLGILPGSPAETKSLHRSEKTAIATKYGATGVIIINTVKNGVLLTGTASVTGKLILIPAICIGLEDGMALKEKLKSQSQTAHIAMTNFSGVIKARNVVATFKGTELPKDKIVVGGHLDSWDLATGAIDNGIGSFAVIDMARTFRKLNLKTKRTVEFVLFMGEEQGLLGSKAYIDQAKKDKNLDQVKFMLNYDMTNDPKGFATSRAEMKELFTAWGADIVKIDTGFKNLFNAGAGLHSDHQPFMLEGIPTGGGFGGKLPNNSGPFYHSDGDSFKLVDEQELKNTVRYSAMLTYALANTPKIPVGVQEEDELRAFLESQNLKEPLTIAGEWRWK